MAIFLSWTSWDDARWELSMDLHRLVGSSAGIRAESSLVGTGRVSYLSPPTR